jgi:hypothetical protein
MSKERVIGNKMAYVNFKNVFDINYDFNLKSMTFK